MIFTAIPIQPGPVPGFSFLETVMKSRPRLLAVLVCAALIPAVQAGSMSNYLQNKLIDFLLRGQAFSAPATIYVALYTVCPTAAGGGTEVSGGSYARVAITASLANFAGTQSAGSTTASSGTTGQTSNNAAVIFPSPTGNWGTVDCAGALDSASGGNLLLEGSLTATQTINNGASAPTFAIASFNWTIG